MNGPQLTKIAWLHRFNRLVVFITGHAKKGALDFGLIDPGMQMIAKPFARDVLAVRIRDMIRRIDA